MKKCSRCGQEKPIEDFQQNGNGKRRADCRICQAIQLKAWRAQRAKKPIEERYPTGMKLCKHCQIEKPVSDFSPHHGGYLHDICKACDHVIHEIEHADDYNRQFRIQTDAQGQQIRKCRACLVTKPITNFQLRVGRRSSTCMECERARANAAYAADPESHRAYSLAWAKAHPEQTRARYARWSSQNRERRMEYYAQYNAAHLAERRTYARKRHAQESPELRIYLRVSRRGYFRRYDNEHRQERNESSRKRYQLNPQKRGDYQKQRAAQKANAPRVERINRKAIIERDKWTCYLCWCVCTPANVTLDHIVPLSRGGNHTADNLRVACKTCNARKGTKFLPELS